NNQFQQSLNQQMTEANWANQLANAQLAQKNLVDQANATGFWNGQQTLGWMQAQDQRNQFATDQANRVNIANMENQTNLQGINVQRDIANNQMNQFLAQWLASQGYPKLPATK